MVNPFINTSEGESLNDSAKGNSKNVYSEILKEMEVCGGVERGIDGGLYGVIGVPDIEDDYEGYCEYLLFIEELSDLENDGKVLWLNEGIPQIGENVDLINMLNRYWIIIDKLGKVTAEDIIKFTYRNHPTEILNKGLKNYIDYKLEKMLEKFMLTESNLDIIKNYHYMNIIWVESIVSKLENGGSLKNLIIEGRVRKSFNDFLNLLTELGVSITYLSFSLDSSDLFFSNENDLISNSVELEGYINLSQLKLEKESYDRRLSSETTTVARVASEEINNVLHGDGSGLIKPWQFEDYDVRIKKLKSTYDEVLLLWNEKASVRSGFEVNDGVVYVPSFFVKISGVPDVVEKYWMDYDILSSSYNTLIINDICFMADIEKPRKAIKLDNGIFNLDDVKNLSYYDYGHLRDSIQDLIINNMNELITDNLLLLSGRDREYKILEACMTIPDDFLEMLQKFDFGQEVPKIVVYIRDKDNINETEAIVIGLLNNIGFDIVFLVPTGYTNIESYYDESLYETHRLDRLEFGLDIPEIRTKEEDEKEGFWENIRNKFFK